MWFCIFCNDHQRCEGVHLTGITRKSLALDAVATLLGTHLPDRSFVVHHACNGTLVSRRFLKGYTQASTCDHAPVACSMHGNVCGYCTAVTRCCQVLDRDVCRVVVSVPKRPCCTRLCYHSKCIAIVNREHGH